MSYESYYIQDPKNFTLSQKSWTIYYYQCQCRN